LMRKLREDTQDTLNDLERNLLNGQGEVVVASAVLCLVSCCLFELLTLKDKQQASKAEQIRYFDLWRVICVACVVITHVYEGYHQLNFFAVGQWVLQFLMLISGFCFARSEKSLLFYCRRLAMIWAAGTLLNWMALVAIGADWKADATRLMYQMGFALQIMVAAIFLFPLKCLLSAGELKENQDCSAGNATMPLALYSSFALLMALFMLHPSMLEGKLQQSERLPIELFQSAAMLFLATALHALLPPHLRHWIGWALLLPMQLSRVLHAEPRPGSEVHLNDLYMWAVFIHYVPLKFQSEIGLAMAQLWPVWAIMVGFLLGLPGNEPSFPSLNPSPEMGKRARFYGVETILVLAFVCIPAAGKDATMVLPKWLGPPLKWLNLLSLIAFCSHKAIIDLLQH